MQRDRTRVPGKVGEQLCEVELRIDVMPPAGGGQAGKDSVVSSFFRSAPGDRQGVAGESPAR
jgi:hypothetical protein